MQRDAFYIAGYDPKGYRYYYSIFKKNLSKYCDKFSINAQLSKPDFSELDAGLNTKEKLSFWQLSSHNVDATYTFLPWNDLVRKNWSEGFRDGVLDAFIVFKIYIITGRFLKFGKESIYQLITGFYPFFYVLFSLLISLGAGLGLYFLLLHKIGFFFSFLSGFLLAYFINDAIFKFGKKIAVFWIARICAFCARWSVLKHGEIEARMEVFANLIYAKLKENQNKSDYELLLFSHSVGTILCIEVLAKIIQKAKAENISLNALKIITLGECIPLTSYQNKKRANEFKKSLELVSSVNLTWLDYTSIIDGACFPQVDFFTSSGVDAKFKPEFLSTRFHSIYEKNHYKKLKKNKLIAHFLYLYAPDFQGGYDFFDLILNENLLKRSNNELSVSSKTLQK